MSSHKKKNSNAAISSNANIPPKPVRPYTAYHIFFQLERNYILQTNNGRNDPDLTQGVDDNANERPEKYRNIIMPKNWFIAGARRKKRKDHKVHGIISFIDLTKTVSTRWNCADDDIRTYCKDLAEKHLFRYYEKQKAYVDEYGEEAMKAQGRKRKSPPKKSALHPSATMHDSRSLQIFGPNPNNAIAEASAEIEDRKMPGNQVANNDLTDQSRFSSIDPLPPLPAMHQAPLVHSNSFQINFESFRNANEPPSQQGSNRVYRLDDEVQNFIARIDREEELISSMNLSDSESPNSSPRQVTSSCVTGESSADSI